MPFIRFYVSKGWTLTLSPFWRFSMSLIEIFFLSLSDVYQSLCCLLPLAETKCLWNVKGVMSLLQSRVCAGVETLDVCVAEILNGKVWVLSCSIILHYKEGCFDWKLCLLITLIYQGKFLFFFVGILHWIPEISQKEQPWLPKSA